MDQFQQILAENQAARDARLIDESSFLGKGAVTAQGIGFRFDPDTMPSSEQLALFSALEKKALRYAIEAAGSLAKDVKEGDHLGGALGLIPSLNITSAMVSANPERFDYAVEHGHTSAGIFAVRAAHGTVEPREFIDGFRRGIDFPGHDAWMPGGSQINGGRLGVVVPMAVGRALWLKAQAGPESMMMVHMGDAGWISGQAQNGMNLAVMHDAPAVFIMDRNWVQLSGFTDHIVDDRAISPAEIAETIGINVIEINSLHNTDEFIGALQVAYKEYQDQSVPSLIYPTGTSETLEVFLNRFGLTEYLADEIEKRNLFGKQEIFVPGSIMGYGDPLMMLDTICLVSGIEGGKGHHDGGMVGRDLERVLSNPLLQLTPEESAALESERPKAQVEVVTRPRPARGSRNLDVTDAVLSESEVARGGNPSPRSGASAAYETLGKHFADQAFTLDFDIESSTKLGSLSKHLPDYHRFQCSIQEQAGFIAANGLALGNPDQPQITVASTFSAFFNIAREGMALLDHQRNLNGHYEGLNVLFHMSHVGSQVGRDHASGMNLKWIDLMLDHMDRMDRVYAASDARSAYLSIMNAASRYGGHIVAIPRDKVGILTEQGSDRPFFDTSSFVGFDPMVQYRNYEGAKSAIIAIGAPSQIAGLAAEQLTENGTPTDVHVVNYISSEGPSTKIAELYQRYSQGIVTVEDNEVGQGYRGFAGYVNAFRPGKNQTRTAHVGIQSSSAYPSGGADDMWEHFGITQAEIVNAVTALADE